MEHKKGMTRLHLLLLALLIAGCSPAPPRWTPSVPTVVSTVEGRLPSPTGTWLPSEMIQPTSELPATATERPTVTVTPEPTETWQPTATAAPTLTPTLAPTATPQPTATKSPSPTPAPKSQTAQVVRIIDGDTIEVQIGDASYKVRLIGVDTPEQGESFSEEAMAYNRRFVENQTVVLVRDVSETDKSGRLWRYVYVGDIFVNAELVRRGYAKVATYPPDVEFADYFVQLQREAREAGRGLWGATPTPPAMPIRPTPTPVPTVPPSGG